MTDDVPAEEEAGMTVPFRWTPSTMPQPVRRQRGRMSERDKLVSIGITLAIHALILAAALTAVHVPTPR